MATSGVIRPSSNGVLATWSLASQNVAGNYSIINVAIGWSFQSSPTDRQLDNGLLQVDGLTLWQVTGRVKNFTGSTGAHDYYAWNGQRLVGHDAAGNATMSIFAKMTGYSGNVSSGSGSFALPQIPRFPGAPTGLSVSGHTDSDPTTVTLSWAAPSDQGAGLDTWSADLATKPDFSDATPNGGTPGWVTSNNRTGLKKGTTYYARAFAHTAAGFGPASSTLAFTTGTTAPSAPSTPIAFGVDGTSMTVVWGAPADDGGASIASYEVRRADNSSFTAGLVTTMIPGTGASFNVTGLAHTKTYFFAVRAVNAAGKTSGFSPTANFTTAATVPTAPAAPTVTNRTPTDMTISWSAPSDNGGSAILNYDVQWSEHPNFDAASLAVSGSPYTIRNLQASTQYYTRVRAFNAVGDGPFSAPTPVRTTSGARVPNAGGTAWVEADAWVAVQGAQGYEWRVCQITTIAG